MESTFHEEATAKYVANSLLKIEAIKLSPSKPFKWASGWNSPIYCDNRLSLSFPEIRTAIKDGLANLIKETFKGAEAIAGVATAGIPQGALVADVLNLPFLYVRSKPKDHGMTNLIEGKIIKGQKVVVIEDLISTGGSSLQAVQALTEARINVMGMAAIFTYGFSVSEENFRKAGVTLKTLTNYNILIQEASASGYVKKEELASLESWRKAPAEWMK